MLSRERLTLELNARLISIIGVMIAIVFVLTAIAPTRIPMPGGFAHLGDTGIYFAAFLFGPVAGGIAGAFGTALADVYLGYGNYAPGSFIIHGIQGVVAGLIAWRGGLTRMIVAVVVGGAILIGGYFVYDLAILRLGWGVSVSDAGFNFIQALGSAILSIPLVLAVRQAYPPIVNWGYQRTWQEEKEPGVEAD